MGIFSALRRRPKFSLRFINSPTFCCNDHTGKKYHEYDVHRTGFAIYLEVTNVGTAASSIQDVAIAYHWNIIPFSIKWLRYSFGWHWEERQTVALDDFQVEIGEKVKIYPFLFQGNSASSANTATFLQRGQSTNGVVYFEQEDSWGACSPKIKNNAVLLKVMVFDAFGKGHVSKFRIPAVSLEHARKYNPSFGETIAALTGIPLPIDSTLNEGEATDQFA